MLSLMDSNPTWNNNLHHPLSIVLRLNVLRVCFINVCKVASAQIYLKKNRKESCLMFPQIIDRTPFACKHNLSQRPHTLNVFLIKLE